MISLGGSRPRIELTYRGQLPDGRFGSLAGVREIGTTVSEGKAILEMNSFAQVAEVLHGLRTLDVNVIDFNLHSPNLSDAFIALTGHTLPTRSPERIAMLRAIWLTTQNEARLLVKDPIVLFMLLFAPVVIITVAGYSLGSLYGGSANSFRLPWSTSITEK